MVNFICQVDQAMEYPDIWSNVILNVPVRMFVNKINIWISRLPSQMWGILIQPVECLNTTKRLTFLRENSRCQRTLNLQHWLFPASRLELIYWLFLDLELAFKLEQHHCPSGSLSLCISQELSAPIILSFIFFMLLHHTLIVLIQNVERIAFDFLLLTLMDWIVLPKEAMFKFSECDLNWIWVL